MDTAPQSAGVSIGPVSGHSNPRSGNLNRLEAIYGGRIFPERPENAEIGRNGGFSHRQVWPAMLRRRRPAARHSLPASCHR